MSQIRIMLVGDVHGQEQHIIYKIEKANALGIQHILQVGDMGIWPGFDGVVFLDEIQKHADKNNVTVYAIPGNHEWHDEWEHLVATAATSRGFAMVRSRVALAPKIHSWTWNHKQFISAGGAISVDREWRLQEEAGGVDPYGRYKKGTGERTLYWPNETLSDDDMTKLRSLGKKADYLITHDASNHTPWQSRLKNDPESEDHRRKIDEVIRATKPNLHFHGHFHQKYDWENNMSSQMQHVTQTYGLECDTGVFSWGVLDTSTDKFMWPNELV